MNNFISNNIQPGPNDVLIGRGKRCYNHIGNINLNNIVASRLDEYSNAETKQDKSMILADVVDKIRNSSLNSGFLKQESTSGLWIEVTDVAAREKTSQAFRDALHEKYRSSNLNKKKQKKQQREIKRIGKSFECSIVTSQPMECNDQACTLQILDVPTIYNKIESSNGTLDHFTSSLHSFDMDMDLTVLQGTNHASIVSLEDLDDLSISSESSDFEFAEDEFSDASFDDEIDDLLLEDYSFKANTIMIEDMSEIASSMDCAPQYNREKKIDVPYQLYRYIHTDI